MTTKKIDLAPGDAGGASIDSAMDFFNNDNGPATAPAATEPTPAPAPDPAPEPTPAPAKPPEDNPSELTPFEPIDPPGDTTETPPAAPLQPSEESVPDHVAKKGEAAITTWKAARQEARELKARLEDVERDREIKALELTELQSKVENAPSEDALKELETKVKEYEDQIGRMDVTKSKMFQETYDKPINDLFGKVVGAFVKNGHPQNEALELARKVFRPGMQEPSALEAALPEEPSMLIGAVSMLLEDRESLAQKRAEAIQNHEQTRAAAEAEQARQSQTEMSQQLTSVSESAFEAAAKDGSWLYSEGTDAVWNEGVQARRDTAMGYIRAGKPEDLARLVAEGIASPIYRRGYEQLKVAYEALKAKHEGVVGRRPGLENTSAADYSSAAPVEAPKTANEFVDQAW